MKILFCVALIMVVIGSHLFAEEKERKPDYLSLQSGTTINNYNSMGLRLALEYSKDIKNNWQYGLLYEHSTYLYMASTDGTFDFASDMSLLSFNLYYKLHLKKDKLFWTTGLGLGVVHVSRVDSKDYLWAESNRFSGAINYSLTLNVKLFKRVYLEASPLVILFPVNRVYYSPMDFNTFDVLYAANLFPFGIKVKL